MTRLVDTRATKLTEDQIRGLWELIDDSRKKDKEYFELCRNLRALLKSGTSGELDNISEEHRVVANLAHAHLSAFMPQVFFSEPTNVATPTHPRHEGKEKTWAAILNYTQKKTGLKREVTRAVRDAAVYPEGWLKHFVNVAPETEGEQSGETSRGKNKSVGPISEDGGEAGPTEWLTKGSPAVARVAPTSVIVDYLAKDRSLEQARFVSVTYLKTIDDLKADPRYKQHVKDLQSNSNKVFGRGNSITDGHIDPFVSEEDPDTLRQGSQQDKFVILHEVLVYQLTKFNLYKQVVVLIEGVDGLIMEKPARKLMGWEEMFGAHVDQYPLERLVFNEVPDDLPNSELGVWSGMASTVNWLLTRLTQFVDNQKQIFEVEENKLIHKEKAYAQLRKGGPRSFVGVTGLGAIAPVQNHLSTRDDSLLFNVMLEMIRRVSGQSENQQGGDKFRTATAAATAARSGAAKAAFDVDAVGEFLKRVSTKQATIIRSLVAEDGNTEFVFNIAGDSGSVNWLRFTNEDINWMPEITIEVGSFTKPRRDEEVQKAAMALSTGLQALPAAPDIRISVLYKKLLEAMEFSEIGTIIDTEEDQAIVQAAEATVMALGGQVSPSPGENHAVHMRVLDMILNSPQLQQADPAVLGVLIEHRDGHEQMLRELTEGLGSNGNVAANGQNVFDLANPANVARADTARDREAVPAAPGQGGERL